MRRDKKKCRINLGLESAVQFQEAIMALQWLCYSTRPLQLFEIREFLAIVPGHEGGFCPDDYLPDPFDIMLVRSSLISCDEIGSGRDDASNSSPSDSDPEQDSMAASLLMQVRLAPFSAQGYLRSDRCRLQSDLQTLACHTIRD